MSESVEGNREYCRRWRQANKEKVKAINRKWRQANKEKVNAINRKWCQANKERVKAKNARRRTALPVLVQDFFKHFQGKARSEEEFLGLVEDFSRNACGLTGRQACDLEERILLKAQEGKEREVDGYD